MKVTIEVPDGAVPFFEAEAKAHGISLGALLSLKVFAQRHDIIARGGIPTAPTEEQVAAAASQGVDVCVRCKAPATLDHEGPNA